MLTTDKMKMGLETAETLFSKTIQIYDPFLPEIPKTQRDFRILTQKPKNPIPKARVRRDGNAPIKIRTSSIIRK